MNKRDEISIMPYHVEWKHVPDNWPFDKEGNPVYDYYSLRQFEEMDGHDIERLKADICRNIDLKWIAFKAEIRPHLQSFDTTAREEI